MNTKLGLLLLLIVGCGAPPESDEVPSWMLGPFEKHVGNPILTPQGSTWEAKDVFNPTAFVEADTIHLLYRAEDNTGIGEWNGTSRIGLATSTDGLRFERRPAPILEPTEAYELPGGCEDPRVVKIDSTYYLTYTAYDGETARLAMAYSDDLVTWIKVGPLFPERGWTKSGAILTQPIDGRYWMYFGDTNIWAAHSQDLLSWTVVEAPVLRPRSGMFDARLVEPGPQPILTAAGIVLLYNGADEGLIYASGQALLDPNDPTRLLDRSTTPFLRPTVEAELVGQVPNVVFIEGLVRHADTWFLYYGMGDSGIGVATASAR